MAYRLGGDEFAVLVESSQEGFRIESFCGRLITELCTPIAFLDYEFPVGCSIGIAVRHTRDCSSTALYKAADTALYEAKRAGKGTFRISPSQ